MTAATAVSWLAVFGAVVIVSVWVVVPWIIVAIRWIGRMTDLYTDAVNRRFGPRE